MRPSAIALSSFSFAALAAVQVLAAEYNPARTRPAAESEPPVHRFIVKMRASADSSRVQAQASPGGESAAWVASTDRAKALASRARLNLMADRAITANLHVMQVASATANESAAQTLERLRADADVEYAVPDRRVYAHATTSDDPFAVNQWYLQATQPSAINAQGAWDLSKGSDDVVIAVIDTGVRFDHPDLKRVADGGRLLPGYDFVSGDSATSFKTANDGNGRDSDPMDPGDWVASADNCGTPSDSSWHGTRVSGIIGALTNNGTGVAGITWNSRILPVRVLGKCGGFNSDVLAGMLWAAGRPVQGVPANPNPAKVVNVSLGSTGSCDSASADVTSTLASLGVLVVVSAGNEGGPVDSPANCPGAMAVLGLRHAGTKVGFSSLGPQIALGAPGGNCINVTPGSACLFSIDTTTNLGATTPAANGYTDQFNSNVGTSFSAPIVAGIAGLMLGVNSNLTSTHLIARMKESAKPYPTSSENPGIPACRTPAGPGDIQNSECVCNTSACGAGMANANGAVLAALRPIASIAVQGAVTAGSTLTLQGTGSTAANNHTIATYVWTKGGTVISSGPTASVVAPTSGTTSVCLTVSDDEGKLDSAKVIISSASASVSPIAPGSAGAACLPEVTVSATDPNASEAGDTGTFTFTRTGDTTTAMSVGLALSGTATNGTDYQALGASVMFAAGASTATLTVVPIDNTVVSTSKTVTVSVQSGADYDVVSPSSGTVTIAENDSNPPPSTSNNSSGGGGGGGALDPLVLMGLALAVLAALTRARPRQAQQLRQHVAAEQRAPRR